MRKHLAIALIALFSLQLGVGCADGKSNKRAAINASHFGKSTAPDGTAKKQGTESGTEGGTETKQGGDSNPTDSTKAGQTPAEGTTADALIEKFQSLAVEGKEVKYEDLKSITLELQEVGMLYNSNQTDLTNGGLVAFSHYKITKNAQGSFDFTSTEQSQVIGTGTENLLGLPILTTLEIDAQGNTPSIETSEEIALVPQLKDQKMSLTNDEQVAANSKKLEQVFDDIFNLPQEDSRGISASTGAKIFTQIKQSNDAVSILIEAQISESKFQSFVLKFKTSSATDSSNGVTE